LTPKLDKPVHGHKPTLASTDTSPETKALVEALQNVLRNEEAWYIAEEHLSKVRGSIEEKYRALLEKAPVEDPLDALLD
jgi:hypothetical protein